MKRLFNSIIKKLLWDFLPNVLSLVACATLWRFQAITNGFKLVLIYILVAVLLEMVKMLFFSSFSASSIRLVVLSDDEDEA